MKILAFNQRMGLNSALRNLGHEVREGQDDTVFDAFDEFQPDVCLWKGTPSRALAKCIAECRNLRCVRTDYMAPAANSDIIKQNHHKPDTDILYVGDYSDENAKYIYPLLQSNKYRVKIFGRGWKTPYCVGDYYFWEEVYRALMFSNIFVHLDKQPSQILYQALYFGVFCVSTPLPGTPFEFNDYLYTCKDRFDLHKTVVRCLPKKDIRKMIGEKGAKFVREHHTYIHRAKEILELCK